MVKLRGKHRCLPYIVWPCLPPPPLSPSPPEQPICHSRDYTGTSHSPEAAVCSRAPCWCSAFCGFDRVSRHVSTVTVITESRLTALKALCASPFIPPSPVSPGNHESSYCLHSFTFSRMSWSWNHAARSLFRLASLT